MQGSRFIDAGASLQAGRPVDSAHGHVANGLFQAALSIARGAISEHFDAAEAKTFTARFDAAVEKVNDAKFKQRTDSSDAGGVFTAADLRHVTGKVLEEKHPLPNALRLFPVDASVPVGARSFTVKRAYEAGSARVWRGGSPAEIPNVNVSQAEMEFQVRHYVTSALWDIFDEMGAQFSGFDYVARLTRVARDTLERFANQMVWFGDSTYKIFGVLNYPWLDKEVSALVFGGSPSNTKAHLQALNAWVNRQHHRSKGVLGPNKMVTSPRVADWIAQTPLETSGGMRDRTIGEVFGATSKLQGPIEQAWELENVLGENVDAILFYRDDAMGIQNVIPGGGVRNLPLYQTDIERRSIFLMDHGGVTILEVGNCLLVFVEWDPS